MQDDRVENTAVRLMALLCESDCTQKSRMGQGLLVPRTLLCVFVVSYVVEHSALSRAVNLHNRVGRDKRFHDDRGSACKRQPGIPRILHHIFLEGEAAYWRNATVGDVFTPNFYPKARKLGDRNATFRRIAHPIMNGVDLWHCHLLTHALHGHCLQSMILMLQNCL